MTVLSTYKDINEILVDKMSFKTLTPVSILLVFVHFTLSFKHYFFNPNYYLSDSYLAASAQVLTNAEDQLRFRINQNLAHSSDNPTSRSLNYEECEETPVRVLTLAEIRNITETLVKLRNYLWTEANDFKFEKLEGYGEDVLRDLKSTSSGTAKHQIKQVLKWMTQKNHCKSVQGRALTSRVLAELSNDTTLMSILLSTLDPLRYT